MSAVRIKEDLPLREMLEMLLGPEGKRRLRLRHMTNDGLFQQYDNSELVLHLHNEKNLTDTRKMLLRFKEFLGDMPPSPELAKVFLSQFANNKPRTLSRYAQMIKAFMKWYGEPIEDMKVKIPKSLPPYTEDADIDKLLNAIENKKTHKGTIVRDRLLVELALKSGLRRKELADLEVKDLHADFLMVRHGKGDKDRVIPIAPALYLRIQDLVKRMKPDDKVFQLKAPCITMKIKQFARKGGVSDIHAHTLRHKFATSLLEKGANVKVVQELLGHENLSTTQVYLSVTDKGKRDAIKLLDAHPKSSTPPIIQENEDVIIKAQGCFQKDKWGRCRNAGLRSDCGACFYLRLGRTQDDIDRLIELSLNLPTKVRQVKESSLAQTKGKPN